LSEFTYQNFKAVVLRQRDLIKRDMEVKLSIDSLILYECYSHAQASIKFHGKPESVDAFIALNHMRQAAHYCFWISKLKPAVELRGFYNKFKDKFREKELMPEEEVFDTEDIDLEHQIPAAKPINEILAYGVGHDLVMAGVKLELGKRKELNDSSVEEIEYKIKEFDSRAEKIAERIITSMRINNHTARSTAMAFDWAYHYDKSISMVKN